jgi:hypothetical protein
MIASFHILPSSLFANNRATRRCINPAIEDVEIMKDKKLYIIKCKGKGKAIPVTGSEGP